MYTDQAIDNLVKARCNLPFVQVTYSDLIVQDTDMYKADTAWDNTAASTRTLDVVALTGTIMRSFTNLFHIGAGAERDRQMSFKAQPVTDQNDIYQAYLEFAHNPNLLVVTDHAPPCPVHLQRKYKGKWFWIPEEAGPAFLDLVLKTALMRGPETAPPAAYEVRIIDIATKKENGNIYATLTFDKEVPNGNATMVVVLDDGRKVRLTLRKLLESKEDMPPADGKGTTKLKAAWNSAKEGFTEHNLIQRPARIYSEYPPEAPAPAPIQPVVSELERIRLNQAIRRSP